jgi:hypothetical protein
MELTDPVGGAGCCIVLAEWRAAVAASVGATPGVPVCNTSVPVAGPVSVAVLGQATENRGVLGLDQAAADCVACEVDAVAHTELVEDVGAVAFHGFDAENERRCDFL